MVTAPRVLLAAAIACEVTATLSLKAALSNPVFLGLSVAGYLASFVLLALVLRLGMPLGIAYGIWGATGVAATAILADVVFDEGITAPMALGIIAIVGGVLMIESGTHSAQVERPISSDGAA